MSDRISIEEARDLLTRAFSSLGCEDASARSVAHALVAAEVDGQKGHGFSRISSYAAQIKSGKANGKAKPEIVSQTDSLIRIDAANGLAYPALDLARAELVNRTRKNGICGASIFRSHHCGQLSRQVEMLAEAGLVAIMVANTPKAMAPWGGNEAIFGTNPIAFAAPRQGRPPLVIDLSLSKVARGKIMAASKTGEAIEEGWALDAAGQPTTDAKAALAGTMIPMGDAKGAALALMVEVLATSLTGANPSSEASSFFDGEGDPPGVGQMIITIDPTHAGGSGFSVRLEALLASIEVQDGTRLPGERRLQGRDKAEQEGVELTDAVRGELESLIVGE